MINQVDKIDIDYLPLHMVNTYAYCLRKFYYEFIEGQMIDNFYVVDGRFKHKTIDDKNYKKINVGRGTIKLNSVYLSSDRLKIIGKIDCVKSKQGKLYPFEYKRSKVRFNEDGDAIISDNVKIQLVLGALLLEDNYEVEINKGYIYYVGSKQNIKIDIDKDVKEWAINIVSEIYDYLMNPVLPECILDLKKCNGCSLEPICCPSEMSLINNRIQHCDRIVPSLGEGNIIYVDASYGSLSLREGAIKIVVEGKICKTVPINNIKEIVLYGNIEMTSYLLNECLKRNIRVSFLTSFGRFRGRLLSAETSNFNLRKEQYLKSLDKDTSLFVAKQFVLGKIHNNRTLLMRFNRGLNCKNEDIDDYCDKMKACFKQIDNCDDIPTLMGVEGYNAVLYFGALRELLRLKDCDFDFKNRNRRPPLDPVNACLSFGYSLLMKDCLAALEVVGLDPYCGFLHAAKYGRSSLALDLMEEFRPCIVDSLVVMLFSKGVLKDKDFLIVHNGCFLTEKGRKKYYEQYENKKQIQVEHNIFRYKLSYKRMIELQARMLAKFIVGELNCYNSFEIK